MTLRQRPQPDTCIANECCLSLKISRLETSFEKILSQTLAALSEEQSRMLRVRILLVEDEKCELSTRVEETNKQLDRAERAGSLTREDLRHAQNESAQLRNSLRAKLREIAILKTEVNSLYNASINSGKLAADNLALTREISNLKTAVQHLRSQSVSQEGVLSEKLSLERQLSALEVELETEKRALGRARMMDSKHSEADAHVKAQLDEVNNELTKEKRQREKIEGEARSEAAGWERHRTILQGELEALKNMLRDTKEQLRETQEKFQAQSAMRSTALITRSDEKEPSNTRKRKATRFEPHMTIATPGAVHPPKAKRFSTLPGDKSMFSITPYLNRISTAESSAETYNGNEGEQRFEGTSRLEENVDTGDDLKTLVQETNTRSSHRHSNLRAAKARSKHLLYAPSLGKLPMMQSVAEDDHEKERDLSAGSKPEFSTLRMGKNKGRERISLATDREGSFSEDDDNTGDLRNGRKLGFGRIRDLGTRGGGSSVVIAKRPTGTDRRIGVSAEFSPLKRNKKLG